MFKSTTNESTVSFGEETKSDAKVNELSKLEQVKYFGLVSLT